MSHIGGVPSSGGVDGRHEGSQARLTEDLTRAKAVLSELSITSDKHDFHPHHLLREMEKIMRNLSHNPPPKGGESSNYQYLSALVPNLVYFLSMEDMSGRLSGRGFDNSIPYQATINVMQHGITLYLDHIPTEGTLSSNSVTKAAFSDTLNGLSSNPFIADHENKTTNFNWGDIIGSNGILTRTNSAMMAIFETALTSQDLTNSNSGALLSLLDGVNDFKAHVMDPLQREIPSKITPSDPINWQVITEHAHTRRNSHFIDLYNWLEGSGQGSLRNAISNLPN